MLAAGYALVAFSRFAGTGAVRGRRHGFLEGLRGLAPRMTRLALRPWLALPAAALLAWVGLGLIVDASRGVAHVLTPLWLAFVLGPVLVVSGALLMVASALNRATSWSRLVVLVLAAALLYAVSAYTASYLASAYPADGEALSSQVARALAGPLPAAGLLALVWLLRVAPARFGRRRNPLSLPVADGTTRSRGAPDAIETDQRSAPRAIDHRNAGARRRHRGHWGHGAVLARASWDDVVLPRAIKGELITLVRILRRPEAFVGKFGDQLPLGMILHGSPGTGKTLAARTLASAAGCALVSASPAELHQMYVGQSEKAIERLYADARARAPCLVFIDEIDAVASQRCAGGGDVGGAGRSLNSATSQLLEEIDGFAQDEGLVFTVGATNRLDALDEALLSRLSLHLKLDLPGEVSRAALFALHTRSYRARLDCTVEFLAQASKGLSGRDIATVCRSAAMHAYGDGRETVGVESFAHAFRSLGYELGAAAGERAQACSSSQAQGA